jgi:hypothetical protein
MAKDIVFVLHGIGKYDREWLSETTGAVHALKESAREYAFFENNSLDNFVEFVPILYDDVFQRIMTDWSTKAKGLKDSIPVMPNLATEVLSFVEDLDEDDWEKTFAADVVLYWGFRLFQQRVSLRVIKQIVDKVAAVAAAGGEKPDYHVLAHSLGTAVAHDALHHLGTESWLDSLAARQVAEKDEKARAEQQAILLVLEQLKGNFGTSNPFSPRLFSFESITMISNTAGLIHANEGPATSIVRPGTATEHGAYARTYINANHVADSVSIATTFKPPPDWDFAGGFSDVGATHFLPNDAIADIKDVGAWIHSAAHYIANPNLHLRLLAMYVNPYRPTAEDRSAVASFARKHGPAAIKAALKQAYDDLKAGKIERLDRIIDAIRKVEGVIHA